MSLIRPIVEYAEMIWNNRGTYLRDRIEKVQVKAAGIVTGGIKRTLYRKVLDELGWESL